MIIKNINLGKSKIYLLFFLLLQFQISVINAEESIYLGKKVDIKILDKLSSKNKLLKIEIGQDYIFKNLMLKY